MDDTETIAALRGELAALRAQGDALEQELAAKRREVHRSEQIMDIVPGVVFVSQGKLGEPGQRLLYVGGQPEQILGYRREEWLTTQSFALTITHPDDRPALSRLSREFRDPSGRPVHYRFVARDGREVWTETYMKQLPSTADGLPRRCGVIIDVSARVLADQARADLLERSQALRQRLDNVIASVPGMVWEVRGRAGARQETVFVSQYLTTMTGYRVDEVVGSPDFWARVVHPEDAEHAAARTAEVYAQGSGTVQYRWITKDGRTIWVETRLRVIQDDHGARIGAYGLTMDITAQKLAEDERARQKEEMIRAQAATLEQLSTPLIPISAEVMVMPLVGAVDQARAARVIEALLEGINRARARFAIIDITGVPTVDSYTADTLVRAARAVSLLGAKVVLTGVRPEVAQTLVALGVALGGITTCGNLESGIAHATRRR